MGNRAVITTKENFDNNGIGVYLHWNGGRDSVNAFLTYCKMKGFRAPEKDNYGWARLVQVIANFFGGSLSIGIDDVCYLDCAMVIMVFTSLRIGKLLVASIFAVPNKTNTI